MTTTPRFRDFGTGSTDTPAPLSFKLHGETFDCRPAIQGKVMLQLIANSDENKPQEAAQMVFDFFNAVLLDESAARFNALVEDKERIVQMETLGQIVSWLVEEYTNRPTQGSELSSTGA